MMPLKETLERIRSSPASSNEESAKFQVIAPILHALGWDPSDGQQVLFEHSVGGKKGGRVDIALRSESRVLALIEAKAPHADLNAHVEQVLGYAFLEGVDICALTTGSEWWLYLPREPGEPLKRRFTVLKVQQDPLEQLAEDLERFLGKDSLTTGESQQQAKRVLKASLEADRLKTELPKIWDQMLKDPDNELVDLISRRVYETLSIRPSDEQVVAVLRNIPVPVERQPKPPQRIGRRDQERAPERSPGPTTSQPVAIMLWGSRHSVGSYADVLRTVAEKLFERHADDFDRLLQLKGRKHPFVARDRRELRWPPRTSEVASSGYFIDMNLNAANCVRRSEKFLDCFGYPASVLDVLFE